jgi:hypothetical protein
MSGCPGRSEHDADMSGISIVPVDERDGGWEQAHPRYRVCLHGSGERSTGGWTATYDVTGADVVQVIDWAQRQAGGTRTYAVALVHDDEAREVSHPGDGRGLVWLVGMDGNQHDPDDPYTVATQERMLQRRHTPIRVPDTDAMLLGVPSASPELLARLDAAQSP